MHVNDFPVDWFVNNKLIIYFRRDKRQSVHFVSKHKTKKFPKINVTLKYINHDIKIKPDLRITYQGCIPDETISRESMMNKVISKINSQVFCRKNKFFAPALQGLFSNAVLFSILPYLTANSVCGIPIQKLKMKSQFNLIAFLYS